MRPGMSGGIGATFPRPGKVLLGVMVVNVAAWIMYVVLIRMDAPVAGVLALSPKEVLESLYVWQPLTYMLLHSPLEVGHLLFNMLWLYFFGTTMERWWGSRRFLFAYLVCGLAGALFTIGVAALHLTGLFGSLLAGIYRGPHLGASAAVMGIVVSWGVTHRDKRMNFFLLGEMKGSTFILIVIAIELLVALSLSNVSSTSHFGGMIGGAVLCLGLWRPSRWGELIRGASLRRRQRSLERELRVIDGGQKPKKDDWN